MPKNRHTLISSNEAAQLLSEDPRTVQRKAKAGEYPAHKLPGLRGAYVFTVADIELIKTARTKATPTTPASTGHILHDLGAGVLSSSLPVADPKVQRAGE